MRTINIEAGMPSSQQAMTTLNNRIYAERASGAKCAKIIHGYGSTGKGGTIRTVCPEIRKDIDWGRENNGITVVMFK